MRIAVLVLALAGAVGCGPKPPEGKPVAAPLMKAEDAPELPSRRAWYVWHQEGLRRMALAHFDEALFCFRRALEAWPKELPAAERGMRPPAMPEPLPIPPHTPSPHATLLKLAEVHLQLRQPEWALHYLAWFDRENPGKENLTQSLRVQAMAMKTPVAKGRTQPPKPQAR